MDASVAGQKGVTMDAIIVIVAAIVGIGVGVSGGYVLRNAALSRGIDAAKGSAAGLIAEAESEKKRVLLAAQEEALQTRQAAEGELRDRAAEPEFLGSVLDFLLMDDAWVVECCDAQGLAYDVPMRARAALPGGEQVHWT